MIGNLTWRTLFMRSLLPCSTALIAVIALVSAAFAQQPPEKDLSNSPIVTRMMAFNKKKDGKLTKDEVTDTRLKRLFDEADANKDGVVTKEELMALAVKLEAEDGPGGQAARGGPGGGPVGPGGPGGRGPPRPPCPPGPSSASSFTASAISSSFVTRRPYLHRPHQTTVSNACRSPRLWS